MRRALLAAVVAGLTAAGCTGTSGDRAGPAPASAPADLAPASSGAAPAAGAGAHDDSWDVSKMPDPCLTLNRSEVTEATGLRVSAGSTVDSWPPLCMFTLTGAAQEYLYVSSDPRPAAHEEFERQRSDSQATQVVNGVGDKAYWLPEFTALHVFHGTTHLTVKFAGSAPPADPKGKALALARAALK